MAIDASELQKLAETRSLHICSEAVFVYTAASRMIRIGRARGFPRNFLVAAAIERAIISSFYYILQYTVKYTWTVMRALACKFLQGIIFRLKKHQQVPGDAIVRTRHNLHQRSTRKAPSVKLIFFFHDADELVVTRIL